MDFSLPYLGDSGEEKRRIRYSELPLSVQDLVDDIRHGHRENKRDRLDGRVQKTHGIKTALREKYAELIEKMGDCCKPNGFTHFRISRNGDIVFINDSAHYGQAFKRLWNLHLPLF